MKLERASWRWNGEVMAGGWTSAKFLQGGEIGLHDLIRKAMLKEPIYGVRDGDTITVSVHPFYIVRKTG